MVFFKGQETRLKQPWGVVRVNVDRSCGNEENFLDDGNVGLDFGQDFLEIFSHYLLVLKVASFFMQVLLDLEQLLCTLCQAERVSVALSHFLCILGKVLRMLTWVRLRILFLRMTVVAFGPRLWLWLWVKWLLALVNLQVVAVLLGQLLHLLFVVLVVNGQPIGMTAEFAFLQFAFFGLSLHAEPWFIWLFGDWDGLLNLVDRVLEQLALRWMLDLVLNWLVKLVFGVVTRLSVIGFSLLIDFGTVLSFNLIGFGQVD